MLLIFAIVCLVIWIVFTFVVPLGPHATAIHLLLGAAAVLFIRWFVLRDRTAAQPPRSPAGPA
jgi:hypothetical protein